jgi:hypothetical protein
MQGTITQALETEILSMPTCAFRAHVTAIVPYTCNHLPSLKWPHANLAVGDPARHLPRQLAEDKEAMQRSAVHYAPHIEDDAGAPGTRHCHSFACFPRTADDPAERLFAGRFRQWQCRR